MALDQAVIGQSVLVVRVASDGKTRRHLENLGIMSGAELMPLSMTDGNLIVRVRDSRIALDKNIADSIVVRACPSLA